jgi:glycerate-2-kinase
MNEVSLAELTRRLEGVERRQSAADERYVLQAVYIRDMNEIRNDLSEIKGSQTWAMRLIAAQFVALVIALLMFVVERVPT